MDATLAGRLPTPSPLPQVPSLPAISRRQASLARRLAILRQPVAAAIGNETTALVPSGVLSMVGDDPIDPTKLALTVRIGGYGFAARVTGAFVARVTELAGLPIPYDLGDDALALLMVEAALAPLLSRLEAVTGSGWRLEPIPSPGIRPPLRLALPLRVGTEPDYGLDLCADEDAFVRLAALFERIPRQRAAFQRLTATLAVLEGAIRLRAAELKDLEVGDIVLTDRVFAGRDRLEVAPVRRREQPGPSWTARIEGSRLVVDGRLPARASTGEERMTTDESPTAPAATREPVAEGSIAEVEVEITFELARIACPLAELETLGPGHVFTLPGPTDAAVDMVAGGRRIGLGELVDIDGTLGVRITHLYRHG
jgi:type III secretion protein Q